MEMNYFKNYKRIEDPKYPHINEYELEDGSRFFIEPNFYTQLRYAEDYFYDDFNKILEEIINITKKNKAVIFTADFENPVVFKDDFIYQEISDVLGHLGLHFDNKTNPHSDWKD